MRSKKYSIDRVFKLYENYFVFRKSHPDWSETSEKTLKRCTELIKIGYVYPLICHGGEGQKIVLMNHSRFDVEKYSNCEVFPLLYHGLSTLLENEKTQVGGIDFVLNYNDVTFKYISSFTVKQHVDLVTLAMNSTPGRFKGVFLVNMPAYANNFLTLAKMAMSEKMKKRIHSVKSMEELANFIDIKTLPKELGGEIPETEIIENFAKTFENNFDRLKTLNNFEIDLDKLTMDAVESVGSFRKLEID